MQWKQAKAKIDIYYSIEFACHHLWLGLKEQPVSRSIFGDFMGIHRFMSDKTRILVVDDQMAVALMMVFILTRAGCETQSALDAKKALRLAQTEEFDLITLDIDIPGLNGFELFQGLRQIPHVKDTPIIFVSGASTIENQQRALDLGAADFIEKPFDTQDYLSRILAHVHKTQLHEATVSEN